MSWLVPNTCCARSFFEPKADPTNVRMTSFWMKSARLLTFFGMTPALRDQVVLHPLDRLRSIHAGYTRLVHLPLTQMWTWNDSITNCPPKLHCSQSSRPLLAVRKDRIPQSTPEQMIDEPARRRRRNHAIAPRIVTGRFSATIHKRLWDSDPTI